MGKMRYRIRGIRPKAEEEKSTGPKLSIILKGIVIVTIYCFSCSNACFT